MKLKTNTLIILLISCFSTVSVLADSSDMYHGYVTCKGQKGTEAVNLFVGVFSPSGNSARFSLVDITKPTDPWAFEINPQDIYLATIGFQRVAFEMGHHNTIIKLLGDGNIFGGNTNEATERTPYKGKLYLETGNGENPTKQIFDVTCKKTL